MPRRSSKTPAPFVGMCLSMEFFPFPLFTPLSFDRSVARARVVIPDRAKCTSFDRTVRSNDCKIENDDDFPRPHKYGSLLIFTAACSPDGVMHCLAYIPTDGLETAWGVYYLWRGIDDKLWHVKRVPNWISAGPVVSGTYLFYTDEADDMKLIVANSQTDIHVYDFNRALLTVQQVFTIPNTKHVLTVGFGGHVAFILRFEDAIVYDAATGIVSNVPAPLNPKDFHVTNDRVYVARRDGPGEFAIMTLPLPVTGEAKWTPPITIDVDRKARVMLTDDGNELVILAAESMLYGIRQYYTYNATTGDVRPVTRMLSMEDEEDM